MAPLIGRSPIKIIGCKWDYVLWWKRDIPTQVQKSQNFQKSVPLLAKKEESEILHISKKCPWFSILSYSVTFPVLISSNKPLIRKKFIHNYWLKICKSPVITRITWASEIYMQKCSGISDQNCGLFKRRRTECWFKAHKNKILMNFEYNQRWPRLIHNGCSYTAQTRIFRARS